MRVDDPGAAGQVAAVGMNVQTVAGNILVGYAPISAIQAIAEVSSVRSIQAGGFSYGLNDAANEATGVDLVHAGTGLPQGYDGSNVIIGIVDSGIDVAHPAFQHANGGTRVLLLGELLPEAGVVVWNAEQINSAPETVTQVDADGHGTHIAGTAAGGPQPAAHLVGVAPESSLIIVKATRTGSAPGTPFRDVDVVNSTSFICWQAASFGMPAVVNLSLGGHNSPHDGTSNYEQALSNLAVPGCIIVAAAGNDGNNQLHAGFDANPGHTREMLMATTQYPGVDPDEFDLSNVPPALLWFNEGAVSELTFVLYGPGNNGVEEVAVTEPITVDIDDPDLEIEAPFVVGADTLGGVLGFGRRDPNNQDGTLLLRPFVVEGVDPEIEGKYVFGVRIASSSAGRVDGWMLRGSSLIDGFLSGVDFGENVVDGDTFMTVGAPSTAHDLISVASFNSKNTWTDVNGEVHFATAPNGSTVELGAWTWFSSIGPTRDGRLGIDVSSPGNILASAHSQDAGHIPASRLVAGGMYSMKEGTSMAAPGVTGIIALLLQINPELTVEQVFQILHETASLDDHTGDEPNVGWGHGKIDALAAVQATLQTVGVEGPIASELGLTLEAAYPNPAASRTEFAFNLPAAGEASLVVYDMLGRRVLVAVDGELSAGPHRASVPVGALASGIYVARLATADGDAVSRRFTVVR